MTKIGIIFAMEKELELIANLVNGFQKTEINHQLFYTGTLDNKEIIALVPGVGKVNAAIGTNNLIVNFHPDLILNIGVSGALDPTLQIGDIVIGQDIIYHDVWCLEPSEYGQVQGFPAYYHSTPNLTEQLSEFKKGLLCTGDRFISDQEETNAIKKRFPSALAVDMECAAIAQTCFIYNIPLLVLRQISDTPCKHRDDEYYAFWQSAPKNAIKVFQKVLQKIL